MDSHSPTIILGNRYRDRVAGYEGVATAHCTYLSRGPSVCIERQGHITADGKTACEWFDATRLEAIPVDQPSLV